MSTGYIEYNEEFHQFSHAKCEFSNGLLCLEATGSIGKFLLEVDFKNAADVTELAGCTFNPPRSEIFDAVGSSGLETEDSFLSFNELYVQCTQYDEENRSLSFEFRGEAEDLDWGGHAQISGLVTCGVEGAT